MIKIPTKITAKAFTALSVMLAMLSACASTVPNSMIMRDQKEVFQTPEDGINALITASRNSDKGELLKILGPNADKLISFGDSVADANSRVRFVAAYDTFHQLEQEGDNKETLVIGEEEWPSPIPLVRVDGGWQFDTESGEQEILNRRIGRNELNVIETCRAYVEAQREYAARHAFVDGKSEYAKKFISSPDKHDGLYWPAAEGEEESPLGPLMVGARAEGYDAGPAHRHREPYHGYYYKILKRQGPNAAGGAIHYIVDGHMTGGFGLLAFPARYGDSGVMTFIVNQNGLVYQKDLGPDTASIVRQIKAFDPDMGWSFP